MYEIEILNVECGFLKSQHACLRLNIRIGSVQELKKKMFGWFQSFSPFYVRIIEVQKIDVRIIEKVLWQIWGIMWKILPPPPTCTAYTGEWCVWVMLQDKITL